MKKFCLLLIIPFLTLVVSCKSNDERTYKADGTYLAYSLTTTNKKLLNATGNDEAYIDIDGVPSTKTVATPVITVVTVTIHNDEIVSYYIDELESRPFIKPNTADTEKFEVTWRFNEQSKKELGYQYDMGGVNGSMDGSCSEGGICKEWFLQASSLERLWLTNASKSDIVTSVTINTDLYTNLVNEALDNAKKGIAYSIEPTEHYTNDVTIIKADVNEDGKLSNITIDAKIFGPYIDGVVNQDAYNKESANYLKFGWPNETKYQTYLEMNDGKTWQSMIDKFTEYLNTNGWDETLTPGTLINGKMQNKGVTANGKPIDILSSVTIQLSSEVAALNRLASFFPKF